MTACSRAWCSSERFTNSRSSTVISTIITIPPTYSATVNCQPISTHKTSPSSHTRFVEANWNASALAAVLWSGGISFAGVLAFLFADLIVLPIVLIYRKYYGWSFTLRIVALMFVTMVIAALVVSGLLSLLGAIPSGPRPTRGDIFGSIHANYKLALNVLGLLIFAALFWITARQGATDPTCGMKVDRNKAIKKEVAGTMYYFCSEHCLHAFETGQVHDHGEVVHAH